MKSINCGQKPAVGLWVGEFFLLHTSWFILHSVTVISQNWGFWRGWDCRAWYWA